MIDHLTRVVLDTVNERRLAAPQHGDPQSVKSRAVDHAALVAQLGLRVDHRHVEPRIIGPESRRPHDRADLAAPQVKLQRRRPGHTRRLEALGSAHLIVTPVRMCPIVERVQQAPHLQVRERETLRRPPEKRARPLPASAKPAQLIGFVCRLDPGLAAEDFADVRRQLDRIADQEFFRHGLSRMSPNYPPASQSGRVLHRPSAGNCYKRAT